MAVEILFSDNHLVAAAKPAGMATVPDETGDRSLLDEVRDWIRTSAGKQGNVFVGVVHRLDRPVSGLVLFARTSKAASRLSEAWRTRAVEKRYLGLVAGRPAEPSGEVEQWLLKDERRNVVRLVDAANPDARRASSRYEVLAEARGVSLLRLVPLTGRPHQLRVLCQSLGTPLLGDLKYGASRALADASIALHASELVFPHPVGQRVVSLRCEPPDQPWWNEWRSHLGSER